MEVKNVDLKGNVLTATVSVPTAPPASQYNSFPGANVQYYTNNCVSLVQSVANVITINLKMEVTGDRRLLFFAQYKKEVAEDMDVYKISLTISAKQDTCFFQNEATWRLIYEVKNNTSGKLDLPLTVEVNHHALINPYAALYNDSSLADFELRGEDGFVKIHKFVLAAVSPTLKAFLESEGEWLEKTYYKFKDVSQRTLQHLKDYLYLGNLPETTSECEDLILVAKPYLMEVLEKKCIYKILRKVTAENATDTLRFAFANDVMELYYLIFEQSNRSLHVKDIRHHDKKLKGNFSFKIE